MSVTNVTPPVVSGTAKRGQTLHTTDGTWTTSAAALTYTYQWERCDTGGANCVDIQGATGNNYSLTSADVGHTIRAEVTATEAIPPVPPSEIMLPATQVTLDTGEIAGWAVYDGPTTEIIAGSNRATHCLINWTAGHLYETPQTMYSLHGFKMVTGNPGRMYDFHTSPADNPYGWSPPCSSAVAPLAIDYHGAAGLEIVAEPEDSGCSGGSGNYHFQILTQGEVEALRGTWVWIWMEVIWDRGAGSIKAWLAGEDPPRVNESGINNYWSGQHFVTFWNGAYRSGGAPSTVVAQHAATRIGQTPQQCFENVPTVFIREGAGPPDGSAVAIASVDGGGVAVPASLQW